LLAIDKKAEVANCSVTLYEHDATLGPRGSLRLKLFKLRRATREAGAPVTSKPDANLARASKQPVAVTAAFLRRWQIPSQARRGQGGSGRSAGDRRRDGSSRRNSSGRNCGAAVLARASSSSPDRDLPATSLGVAVPEARVFSLPESADGFLDRKSGRRAAELAQGADAILVGPGMMTTISPRLYGRVIRRIEGKPT